MNQSAIDACAKGLKTYSDRKCGTATYGWSYEDGSTALTINNACHADILNHHGHRYMSKDDPMRTKPDVTGFFSFVQGYERADANLWHLEWMLDPTVSPWRSILPKEPSITSDGDAVFDAQFVRRFGLVFTDLSIPANVMVNMMIAGRITHEHKDEIARWVALVKLGVHPSIAHVLRLMLQPSNGRYRFMGSLKHSEFMAWQFTDEYVKNFCNGVIHNGNDPVGKATQYTPVNACFAKTALVKYGEQWNYWDTLLKLYPDLIKKKNNYLESISLDDLVELGKREQQRMGLDDWRPVEQQTGRLGTKTPANVELHVYPPITPRSPFGGKGQDRGFRVHL